jgi:hypothetical protein
VTASACSNSRTCTFTGPDSRRPLRLALAPASSLLFSLRCRLHSSYLHSLHRTAKYILTHVLSDGTRGEDTRMLAISHNCGHSDTRTELLRHLTSPLPITTVGLQTQYCITVIASRFTQRGGTNSCSQTLAPRMFLVSVKKIGSVSPWNSEPPMTPLGSSNPVQTHCQIQSSRRKGLSTEFFYKPNPGLGHAHTIRLMVMSRSRRVFRVVHPPRCIHSGIFVLFSLGLHAARIINAGSLIRGSSVLLYGV